MEQNPNQLEMIARALVTKGKGILAADESTGTIKKRFDSVQLESNEENRRAYREMLFSTPGVEQYISGVILYDETIRQSTHNGIPFPKLLESKGIFPGIKVDKGAVPLANFPGEKIPEGLDGLRARLAEYRDLGAKFTKWRAVINIAPGLPTLTALRKNASVLACYAALSQEQGLTPIVEPEVLMDGDHSMKRCAEVTEMTLGIVFEALREQLVAPEGMLLKPNMVLPGKDNSDKNNPAEKPSPEEIAAVTLRLLRHIVPPAVPGIVFLSGGQTPEEAAERLAAMNAMGGCPWELSFSYGRGLQDYPLKTWRGVAENVTEAQEQFYTWARIDGEARNGVFALAEGNASR